MPLLRTDGEYGKYLTDQSRKIPEQHLKIVCKVGSGVSACRYLSSVAQGFTCVKNTPLKAVLDKEVQTNANFKAKGDNCDGFGINDEKKEDIGTR